MSQSRIKSSIIRGRRLIEDLRLPKKSFATKLAGLAFLKSNQEVRKNILLGEPELYTEYASFD